jgi:hypothetical protein
LKDDVFPHEIGIQWKKFFKSKVAVQHWTSQNIHSDSTITINDYGVSFSEDYKERKEEFDQKYTKFNDLRIQALKSNDQQLLTQVEIRRYHNILYWVCELYDNDNNLY